SLHFSTVVVARGRRGLRLLEHCTSSWLRGGRGKFFNKMLESCRASPLGTEEHGPQFDHYDLQLIPRVTPS
ncbi:MAG: hypothetical protein ACE5HV_11500, partial [Acidobacteriota bacterium]